MNMSMRILICLSVFILTGHYAFAQDSSTGPVPAGDLNIAVDVGIGAMGGYTKYQIGGDVKYADGSSGDLHFPISELKFPLDVYMASVSASAEFKEKWKLVLNVKKNITEDAGTMEDSDWGYWHNGADLPHAPGSTCDPDVCSEDSLDIYSESDTELDALKIDVDLRYKFLTREIDNTNMSFFAGLGGIYENFDFEISDVDQWYPSYEDYFGVDLGHDKYKGKVLTYDIKYFIPYIKVGTAFTLIDTFGIEGSAAFSPYLIIKDEDNHILRDKVSKGELEGYAVMGSLEGRYNFSRHWFSKLEFNYMYLFAEGEQDQEIGGASFATIDEEITSEQMTALIKAGYSF